MTSIVRGFRQPPAEFRPMPLWVWNDDLSPQRVRAQLRVLKRMGMGGAFVHPRPGLITPYMGETWWRCWAAALDEAKRLGLKLQIYDENSYPSGFGGGHVPSQLPHTVGTGVILRPLARGEAPPEVDLPRRPKVLGHVTWEGTTYVVEMTRGQPTAWLGGFAYVDLLRPETTQKFLEVTHEQYFRRFGKEFGRTITAAFYDEPMISKGEVYGSPGLPFSLWFAGEFRRRKGYDLVSELPKLFLPLPGYRKVRFDYYDVSHQLFVENWAQPMQRWCREHRLMVTGHYMEHTWLYPHHDGTTDAMAMYEWMDMPGIDMLEARVGLPATARTDVGPDALARELQKDALMHLTVLELRSAANQLGLKRTLCEAYGAGGYDSTFEDYKRIGDWLFVNGVNHLNQHLSYMTICGARKRDHPQTFSEHAAWWREYQPLNDYFGRLASVLSKGRMRQRVLLLHPTLSGWVEALPGGKSPALQPLFDEYLELVEHLCDRFWDFDFGDELIMANRGRVAGRALHVGLQRYDVVVVPAHMLTLRSSTVTLLERFTKGGGRVIQMGELPPLIDGERSERLGRTAQRWSRVDSLEALDRELERRIGRIVEVEAQGAWPEKIGLMRRELDRRRVVYFFTNTSGRRVRMTVQIPERGAIERWDPFTGAIEPLGSDRRLELDFEHCESALFVIDRGRRRSRAPRRAAPMVTTAAASAATMEVEPLAVKPAESNVLAIDYCDLQVAGQTHERIHHWVANALIAQAHGFDRPVWDSSVQFRSTLLDRDHFPADSGFQAHYSFEARSKPRHIELAIERPELYRVEVNGKPVSFARARPWLEGHIRSADISSLVRRGRNRVTLIGSPYRLRMELEPIYLRGDFAVAPIDAGFCIVAPTELRIGSWRRQGWPFYGDAVTYTYRVRVEDGAGRFVLRLPQWSGAVAAVKVNGGAAGQIAWPRALTADGGYELELTGRLRAGDNRIAITVYGTLKNLLGPFHVPASWQDRRPRRSAWPSLWIRSPRYGPPAGAQYDQIDYGLMAHPELLWMAP